MAPPHKGNRKPYMTRMPVDIAERIDHDAEEAGIPYSVFIADIVAEHYGLERPSNRTMTKAQRLIREQEELPMTG